MSRDPGDIPAPRSGSVNLVEALAAAQHMPAEALELAARSPHRIVEPVLAVVERAAAGEPLAERDQNLLFWGVHALAEARERRLLGPLLRLMRRPDEELELLLADTITETFPRMVASLYDGDWPALEATLADRTLNDIARWNLFLAAAWLAAAGRIERGALHAFLARFDADKLVGSSDQGWLGWESVIALSGFADLAPRVDAARADGRLLEDLSSPEDFAETLAAAVAAPDDLGRFADQNLREFGSAIDELDSMLALREDEQGEMLEPVRNPLRDLGRNDPCPCGSGRKYKKCCLAA